jgi:hypothetical protein
MKHKLLIAFFSPLLIAGSLRAQCTPITPTATNASVNCGGSAALTATGSAGYQWWDQATGGTLLASTATYNTPALTSNMSYYVEGTDTAPQDMMGLPGHSSIFSGSVRGYYFTAPVDFIITGLKMPPEVAGLQNIAVMRFPATPPLYSTVTNTFTMLFLTQNDPTVGIIPVNIQVYAGDIIGILGQAGTSNSYGATNFATTIAGQPVTLNRLGMQFNLNTTAPQDLWTESGGSISRVEMYYTTMCASPRVQVDVAVNPIPVAATAATPTLCGGGSTTLTATGATTFNWMPGNMSGSSVTVSPSATETYTVTGTDPSGCTNTAMVTVTVASIPTVVANSTATTVCSGDPVTLTGSGAATYTWAAAMTVTDNVAFNPTATDTYTVTGTDANGCSNTDMITVNVNALPTVVANSTATTVCSGDPVTLTGSGATSYTWAAAISVTDNVAINPTATDTYTVTGTDGNGCSNTDMITVNVNALPTVVANSTATTVCAGDPVTLTGSGATSYTWAAAMTVTDNIAFTPTATDTYTVTGTDGNGCSNTDMITVNVNALPAVAANSTTTAVCTGSPVTLTGSGAATYTWSGSVTDGVAFNPTTTDTYTVTGTDANGCVNTDMVTVTVNPLPTVSGSAASTTVCLSDAAVTLTGNPAGGTWSGTGVTGNSFTPSAAGTGPETVTYLYSDVNGCEGNAPVVITVNACVGVTEELSVNNVNIFPNPNNGAFTIAVNANVGDVVIVITDMQGRVVYSSIENNVQSGFTKQISLEKEAAGLYFVSITANGEQRTEKISVQK